MMYRRAQMVDRAAARKGAIFSARISISGGFMDNPVGAKSTADSTPGSLQFVSVFVPYMSRVPHSQCLEQLDGATLRY